MFCAAAWINQGDTNMNTRKMAPSVAAAMGMSTHKCKVLYEEFWDTFAGVKVWQDELKKMYPEGEEPEEEPEEEEPMQEAVLGMLFDIAQEMQDGDKDAAAVVAETVEDIQAE